VTVAAAFRGKADITIRPRRGQRLDWQVSRLFALEMFGIAVTERQPCFILNLSSCCCRLRNRQCNGYFLAWKWTMEQAASGAYYPGHVVSDMLIAGFFVLLIQIKHVGVHLEAVVDRSNWKSMRKA